MLLMREAFKRPQNNKVFFRRMLFEMKALGIDSIVIVLIISIFVGAAIVIQLLLNVNGPMYPNWIYGFAARKAIILELAPTIISLILAGKCASRITSEIGTQKITEQIDALEVMGVNTASYLILPKIVACLLFFPLLTLILGRGNLYSGFSAFSQYHAIAISGSLLFLYNAHFAPNSGIPH